MKHFLYSFILINLFWLSGCRNKSEAPLFSINSLSNSALVDSIGKLDSLVNANKATNNHMAHVYSKQAVSLAMRMNSEKALAKALLIVGISYFNFNNDSSFIYYAKAQKMAINLLEKIPGNEEEIASVYCNLGLRSSDPDTAIKYYQAAINIAQTGNSAEVEIASFNNMAYSYMDKKDYEKAELCLVSHLTQK